MEKLNPQQSNDWLTVKKKRELCLNCSTELEQMCVNNRKGGRTILPLSAEPRAVVEVNETVEECPLNREVIIYQKGVK